MHDVRTSKRSKSILNFTSSFKGTYIKHEVYTGKIRVCPLIPTCFNNKTYTLQVINYLRTKEKDYTLQRGQYKIHMLRIRREEYTRFRMILSWTELDPYFTYVIKKSDSSSFQHGLLTDCKLFTNKDKKIIT